MSIQTFNYIKSVHEREMLQDGYKTANKLEAWKELRSDGFHDRLPIVDSIFATTEIGHSGSSGSWLLRQLRYIAKYGIESHQREYEKELASEKVIIPATNGN